MSSKPEPAQNPELLQENEYRQLYVLCYKKQDIAAMAPELARQKIAKRIYKPGTAKAIAQNLKQTGQSAAGIEDLYTDEAIEERNADKAQVKTIVSDWYNKNSASCAEGKGTIFDVVARPVMARFPELSFRWLDDGVNARLGTDDFERFYDPATGKDYQVGNQYLAFRPREVSERREQDAMEMNSAQLRSVASEARDTIARGGTPSHGDVRVTRDDGREVRL